ncbi:MAG: tetratricopeptide repeat protein, partial [Acidobacteriota bacterium]
RKLRVKVDDLPRRARVSHRAGYFAPGGTAAGLETQLDLAQRLLDTSRGRIGVELHARGATSGRGLDVLVEIDAQSFFERVKLGPGESARAEIYLYAFDQTGAVAGHAAQAASLTPETLPDGETTFTLRTGLELGDGRYDLRALVRNTTSGTTGARHLDLDLSPQMAAVSTAVLPTAPAETTAVAGVGAADGAGAATPANPGAPEAVARRDAPRSETLERFTARYAGELQRLAGGETMADVVQALADAQAEALGDRGERGLDRLQRIAERLERGADLDDATALVLHHDLALRHRRARRAWLAHLSLERSRRLARAVAAHPQHRDLAAAALASLGGSLQAQGRRAGRAFFEAAIAIDPGSVAARLGLAADFEKRGGPWPEVTRQLEALLEHRPESREARLRLGINLLRACETKGAMEVKAKRKAAREHFRQLLGEGDWIDALAAQELARQLLARGKAKAAEKVLAEALERRPEDQEIRILLAFALERSRRTEASRQLLQSADATPGDAYELTPRARYNRWPSDALDEARALLRTAGSPQATESLQGVGGFQ